MNMKVPIQSANKNWLTDSELFQIASFRIFRSIQSPSYDSHNSKETQQNTKPNGSDLSKNHSTFFQIEEKQEIVQQLHFPCD
jgi:hypothetical protein